MPLPFRTEIPLWLPIQIRQFFFILEKGMPRPATACCGPRRKNLDYHGLSTFSVVRNIKSGSKGVYAHIVEEIRPEQELSCVQNLFMKVERLM